ncbi:MAG: guanylate kinase [Candidatus Omnitrophica bacterium CG11_big_fil_rev_8_21_14_0_20_42_13]|uniref:Guanylate kinase n=1 Tax=Candidatus Ghiorseimicrobium undicola TaxID=1974746 RepID=A0A2H0LXM7_9BACT|nr:MAG: guanylate kinase [Candidatus Omnitrophica bacterium CG11_big_fil_rev_8_21_14_0_20_42_13]
MANSRKKREGTVFVISGPSGSGKTTLIKNFLRQKRAGSGIVKVATCTTRPPRGGEKNGRDYVFIGAAEFERRAKKGYFLEWQRVFGQYYGTPKELVKKNLLAGRDVLLCIDVKGARALRRGGKFRFVFIFILPSSDNWQAELLARLEGRLSETSKQIKSRLLLAEKEIAGAKTYDYIIVNKRISRAVKQLSGIIKKERETRKNKAAQLQGS